MKIIVLNIAFLSLMSSAYSQIISTEKEVPASPAPKESTERRSENEGTMTLISTERFAEPEVIKSLPAGSEPILKQGFTMIPTEKGEYISE